MTLEGEHVTDSGEGRGRRKPHRTPVVVGLLRPDQERESEERLHSRVFPQDPQTPGLTGKVEVVVARR